MRAQFFYFGKDAFYDFRSNSGVATPTLPFPAVGKSETTDWPPFTKPSYAYHPSPQRNQEPNRKPNPYIFQFICKNRPHNVVYVTKDPKTDEWIVRVLEAKTGNTLAETRLRTDASAQLQKRLEEKVSGWIKAGVL